MGQFCDPNVIFLEGVVTKGKLIERTQSLVHARYMKTVIPEVALSCTGLLIRREKVSYEVSIVT